MAETPLRPLEVFAIDEDMNRASGTIPYTSLTWSRRYHECGQFSMVVPVDVYDPSWAYIYADARPETGIVQKVEYSDTAHTPDGVDTVTVSGFFLECLLNRLTFLVEQPEEQTIEIHVPEPKPAGIVKSQLPTVYRDPDTDEYFYTNSAGDLVDESGNRVDGSSDWEEVHSRLYGIASNTEGHWATQPNDHIASNFNFYTNQDKTQVTLVSWWGKETTQDVKFSDDKGNAFFGGGTTPDGEHYIYLANSCAYAGAAEGYYTAKRAWDASGGVRYETITVKGPWQRTDTMEPITESDSVDQLFKWLQTFFGSTFKYQEPTFEGVVKTLDPSLQRMGDFAYGVLQEVGASLRVVYGFENDTMVLEAYKGKDRTQDQGGDTVIVYDPILPDGYTQLDWVQSSGSNYVDTGFTASNLTGFDIDFEMAGFSGNGNNHMLSTNGDDYFALRVKADNTGFQARWGTQGLKDIPHSGSFSGRHSIHMERGVYTCDGGDPISFTPESFVRDRTTPIFAYRDKNGSVSGYTRFRLYSLKIRENGATERDFYPARRDSDGTVGLYDLQNSQFYMPNTGVLTAGPESEIPSHEEPVNGNPWAVFSDTWGTIYDYTASRDTSNYKNTCYVLYSYDQPKSFDSDGTPHLTEIYDGNETSHPSGWKVEYETKRGYQVASVKDDSGTEPDLECYLDLRDSGGVPACDSEWSRDEYRYDETQPNNGKPTLPAMKAQYDEWPDALTAKGVAELEQSYGVVTNLDTGTVVTSGYMRDWDLGDKVDFGVSTVGLMSQARIIGVDEVYESGRADIRIEVGDELLTDLKKEKLN